MPESRERSTGARPRKALTAGSEPKRAEPVYQLKITLQDVAPTIWRRVQVPGGFTLGRVHRIVQIAMGWTDSHMHQFVVDGRRYGIADPELEMVDERRVTLGKVAPREKIRIAYTYDFGDSWEHEILVEKILPAEPGLRYPVCLAGKRACPPEDCGGYSGYDDLLEVLRDPGHRRRKEILEWLGDRFDAEAFDLDAVNQALRRLR